MLKTGAKRFYKDVALREEPAGFSVLLDGRTIKTPAGAVMVAPTPALGDAVAAEWRGQGETLLPETMPLTKALNTALDRVAANRAALVDDLAKYAGSDLLCYRAEAPAELVRRQREAWDPWLAWAAEKIGAQFAVTTGVTHVEQSDTALAAVRRAVEAHDAHRLVALHAGITITGSALLGLAFAAGAIGAEDALAVAEVDTAYQAELWGRDAEAERARAHRLADLKAAEAYLKLLG
ncbi:MAG: ATP12 family chaperone protein [Micropepsaceae bacterium]